VSVLTTVGGTHPCRLHHDRNSPTVPMIAFAVLSLRKARARPVHTMASAVRQVQGDPAGVGLLGVERPPCPAQPRQIRARLDMQLEVLVVDHDPRHRFIGGHGSFSPVVPSGCI
jgi:hypothetical protein